jgi:pSer/pThr/pTyr-binding forkhead associated (FHA) protein
LVAPGVPLRLKVIAGPDANRELLIDSTPVSIGRERGNTLVLQDRKVSRYHARIERLDGISVITDLASRNGLRLNGLRINRAGLSAGDYLYLGDSVLLVELPALAGSPDPPSGPGEAELPVT